jgi:hypothetical protein
LPLSLQVARPIAPFEHMQFCTSPCAQIASTPARGDGEHAQANASAPAPIIAPEKVFAMPPTPRAVDST